MEIFWIMSIKHNWKWKLDWLVWLTIYGTLINHPWSLSQAYLQAYEAECPAYQTAENWQMLKSVKDIWINYIISPKDLIGQHGIEGTFTLLSNMQIHTNVPNFLVSSVWSTVLQLDRGVLPVTCVDALHLADMTLWRMTVSQYGALCSPEPI